MNFIKENNIPINMATASIQENIDFYFDYYNLDRWFDKSLLMCENENHIDKVEMYIHASKGINTAIKDCIVFDDSPHSILDAYKAGCPYIIKVLDKHKVDCPGVRQIINDFDEIDRNIFF